MRYFFHIVWVGEIIEKLTRLVLGAVDVLLNVARMNNISCNKAQGGSIAKCYVDNEQRSGSLYCSSVVGWTKRQQPLFVISCLIFFQMNVCLASIPPNKEKLGLEKYLINRGSISGGVAGTGFSLLNMAQGESKLGERWIFDIGDIRGGVLKGPPGYFHVQLMDKPSRLIIDFAQMKNVRIDEQKIQSLIKTSSIFRTAKLLYDPADSATSIVFELKQSPRIKAYQVVGNKNTSKVVVDVVPMANQ